MNLLDCTPSEARSLLSTWIGERGDPQYRTRQILPRLWQRPVADWTDTTDLPKQLVRDLSAEFPLSRPALQSEQRSRDGTVKLLWQFDDSSGVESVLIREGRRRTLCISSQVGCAYGCVFCATGRMGFQRHLRAWEITAQVRELALRTEHGFPSHVVFMGMGEPLHNWPEVDRALTILNDEAGLGIGARKITVSTVGIVPNLLKLLRRPEQFRLALSLHSPFGSKRKAMMPVERKYPLDQVLETARRFPRRFTLEYVMIDGLNDSDDDARELARVARDTGALVNLLRLHPGGAADLRGTSTERIVEFAAMLEKFGAKVTVRRSRGLDINAACGQLWRELAPRHRIEAEDHADVEQ